MTAFSVESFPTLEKYMGDNYLNVGDSKKRDLYKICEELGMTVYGTVFNNDAMSGLIRKRDGKWEIYVNDTDSQKRKNFTIAHELGHYISMLDNGLSKELLEKHGLHEDAAILRRESKENATKYAPDVRRMESEANFIAANLLMPENLVEASVLENKNIEEMATEFGVSGSAIGFRLVNLGLSPIESLGVS